VDGFDKHEATGEADECGEGGIGFVAAQGDTLETLELSHCLLDPRAQFVKRLWEETAALLRVRLAWNDRCDPTHPGCRSVGTAVVPLVGDRKAWSDVRPKIKGNFELRYVVHLTTGQMEIEWIAIEVGLEMDLGREAAA
jgi:hypothetical protein